MSHNNFIEYVALIEDQRFKYFGNSAGHEDFQRLDAATCESRDNFFHNNYYGRRDMGEEFQNMENWVAVVPEKEVMSP